MRKEEAHRALSNNKTEQMKARHNNMKNCAKRVIARSTRKEAEEGLSQLDENPERVFRLMKSMQKDRQDVEGRKCMRWVMKG